MNALSVIEYALDFSGAEGLKAYAATGFKTATSVVTMTRVNTAHAGTGLFIKGTPGESYEVPIIDGTDEYSLNMLVGTLEKSAINGTSSDGKYRNYRYCVKSGNEEPGFYELEESAFLGAGKAYLQVPAEWASSASRSIGIRFDDGEATGIDEITKKTDNGLYYDLRGRAVKSADKGIYIRNGKKVLLK